MWSVKLPERRFFPLSVVIVVALFILLMFFGLRKKKEGAAWATARRGEFVVDLVETGEIRAKNAVVVFAPVKWNVELQIVSMAPEGTLVQKGDTLVQFDVSKLLQEKVSLERKRRHIEAELREAEVRHQSTMSELESALKAARLSLAQAKLKLEKMRYESEAKRREAELALKMAEIELKKAEEKIKAQKIIDMADIEKVKLQLKNFQGKIDNIEKEVAGFTLKAPTSGMVVYEEIWKGDKRGKVAIGDKPRPLSPLISLPDLSQMEVVAEVNEVDREKIEVGQEVKIRLDAYSEKEFTGRVEEIASIPQGMGSSVKIYKVRIAIQGADPILKPGMTASVRFILKRFSDVVYIPIGAVFEKGGKPVVFPKGSTKAREVKLGARNDTYVIVVEGLREGDQVAWADPTGEADILGSAQYELERRQERESLPLHFAAMAKMGLTYDYDSHRGREAKSDSGE